MALLKCNRLEKINMLVTFHKMHGLGNDFVICDLSNENNDYLIKQDRISELSDRKFGIGFDQLVTLHKDGDADIYMRIYNADGSIAGACGNVTRCVAHLLCEEFAKKQVEIKTDAGILICEMQDDNSYLANMGKPKTNWQEIPLDRELNTSQIDLSNLKLGKGFAVNVGNPHIVFFVSDIEKIDLDRDVAEYETHDFFPERINLNVAEILDERSIRLKTFERGAGATLACGTGAIATFYAAYVRGLVGDKVNVTMPGGVIEASINQDGELLMLGEVTYVFNGKVEI